MSQKNTLEIITQHGWRREYPLTKGIIYIGSAVTNDIVLDERYGGGVAPLQVQLITTAGGNAMYKLINLGDTAITIGSKQEATLAPRSVFDLADGLQFKLGEFTLVFHGGSNEKSNPAQNSSSIGLKLQLAQTRLAPNQSLEGIVTVSNLGQRVGARFDLTLSGLEPDCYDIAPGPLLSSGAEKDVLFRLHHRGRKPLAGDWRIVIQATAPETYPGEQATVTQIIQVLPHYQHRLKLTPARGITIGQPAGAAKPVTPQPAPAAKADNAWEVSAANNPPPSLTLKAGEAQKSKHNTQPQPGTAEDWWAEPDKTVAPAQPKATASSETDTLWPATSVGA